ncbi:hypothetical protein LWI29_013005 [Acer saccharum]|uniref:Chromo domain-containing protein n=1 Tax=Acer saccharum TaxID=4024 RepID=A0AA39VDI2_ACESA|nr:hypothetical protein LWI29_013005 [Acer saccharum]
MDSRVEKLEADVNSLTIGQQQILDKLNELSVQFNTRASTQPTNCPPDVEGENSQAPLQNPNRRIGSTNGTSQQGSHYAPRFVKLDFPRFKGEEDTTSWFCRVNQFFEFNHTPEEDRVALASFHLEGDAQLWYQLLKQEKDVLTWQEFQDGLDLRFGVTKFQDFFGDLIKLQQVGSVRDYQTQFEKLLAKVGHLPPNRQVSCFISGLKESIKADVLAGCPATLSTAIGLARLYEARNTSQRRPTITVDLRKNYLPQQEGKNSNATLPVRRLSPTELQERGVKGLCYNCNKKFVPGHRCKKLFLIELCEAEGDGDVVMEEEDIEQTSLNDIPAISLHAISGSRAPETMRVRGNIGRISTIVLVDSGSTHNFINEALAKKVGLQPVQGGQFEVMVASGERLSSKGKCKCVTLLLQGIPVSADFYLLPLEGYDIVLGTQWLRTLGPILWDFAKLQMKFKVAEAEVILQGESCPADQIVGELKFIKEARKGNKGTIFPTPQAVLDRRQRKNEDEILIHWKGLSPAEATWENLAAMQKQFPDHSLEDTVDF